MQSEPSLFSRRTPEMSTPGASLPVTWIVLSSVVQPSSPSALPKSSETLPPDVPSVAPMVWHGPPVVLNQPSFSVSQTSWLSPGDAENDRAPFASVVPAGLPSSVKSQPPSPFSPSFCVPLRFASLNLLTLIVMSSAFPNVTDAVAPDAVTDLHGGSVPGGVLFPPVASGVTSHTVEAPVVTASNVGAPDALVDFVCSVVLPDFKAKEKDWVGATSEPPLDPF